VSSPLLLPPLPPGVLPSAKVLRRPLLPLRAKLLLPGE
jgi:hypothetical protein